MPSALTTNIGIEHCSGAAKLCETVCSVILRTPQTGSNLISDEDVALLVAGIVSDP